MSGFIGVEVRLRKSDTAIRLPRIVASAPISLERVLPLQVGVVDRGCGLRVVGIEGGSVGGGSGREGEPVAVRRGG